MKGGELPSQEGFRSRYYSEMNYQDYTKTFGTCPPAPKLRLSTYYVDPSNILISNFWNPSS